MLNVQDLLADKLEKLLILKGLNQSELARFSNVNVAVIRDIIKKRAWPGIQNVRKLAVALGVPETDLFNPEIEASPVIKEHAPEDCLGVVVGVFRQGRKSVQPPSDPLLARVAKLSPEQRRMLENALRAIETEDEDEERASEKQAKKSRNNE